MLKMVFPSLVWCCLPINLEFFGTLVLKQDQVHHNFLKYIPKNPPLYAYFRCTENYFLKSFSCCDCVPARLFLKLEVVVISLRLWEIYIFLNDLRKPNRAKLASVLFPSARYRKLMTLFKQKKFKKHINFQKSTYPPEELIWIGLWLCKQDQL